MIKKVINKRTIIAAVVILMLAAGARVYYTAGTPVETAPVGRGEVSSLIRESGTVESQSTITMTAKNGGQVEDLFVVEGQTVQIGDILIKWKDSSAQFDIKSQQSNLAGLQVQYNSAKEIAEKNKILYEQGALSYEEYNQSAVLVKQLSTQITALSYSIKSYAESTDPDDVAAAANGVITSVYAKKGEFVAPGAPLIEISDLNNLYVKTDLIAEDADLVETGDKARVYINDSCYSDDSCTVRKIHVKAEEKMSELGISQKRVTVEIDLNNQPAPRLGSNVDVEITLDKRENVIFVDNTAIFEFEKKDYVYVVADGKAVLREVDTGLKGEDTTEIKSGLSEGERVILSPDNNIGDGTRVKEEGK